MYISIQSEAKFIKFWNAYAYPLANLSDLTTSSLAPPQKKASKRVQLLLKLSYSL